MSSEEFRRKKKKRKVLKYRRRLSINIGMAVFGVILAYIMIYAVMYFSRDRVSIYEVVYGKNADTTNKTYTALLLRDEVVANAETSGYLNYYVREGQRVSVGSTVYTIDENGKVQEYLQDNTDGLSLSDEDYELLRQRISKFTSSYSDMNYTDTYDFKIELASILLESANMNAIHAKLEELSASGTYNYAVNKSAAAGIVQYYSDGYENKPITEIKASDFDVSHYKKKTNSSGSLIESGSLAYKTIGNEKWKVLIPLSAEDAAARIEDTRMRIKFTEDGNEVSGDFEIITQNDCTFGVITLDKYMIQYASKRYAEVQIVEEQKEGLKIPKSSIITKDFFTVPIDYYVNGEGENSEKKGFYKQSFDENNQKITEFIMPEIYYSDESYYYLDDEQLKAGNLLIKKDSPDVFTVGPTASLDGVYNVNNGYCVFRRIEKSTESGDYYLVNIGTSYGLKVYDHIVIDAKKVKENDVVFR